MRATLSILGLYNYDTSIFENFTVPDGVDPATAINSIITDNAELEILYPEPNTMKYMIGLWAEREKPVWTRILTAITAEYNPLENYNKKETWADTDIGSNSASGSSTDTDKVAGFNSESLVNSKQTSNTSSGSGSSRLESRHNGTISGNIGVTTSQEMLQQELDISCELDIYKHISDSFKKRFCLMVYY